MYKKIQRNDAKPNDDQIKLFYRLTSMDNNDEVVLDFDDFYSN